MKKIIALGGSNSKNSINKTLAVYVAKQLENTETLVIDLNDFDIKLMVKSNAIEKKILLAVLDIPANQPSQSSQFEKKINGITFHDPFFVKTNEI